MIEAIKTYYENNPSLFQITVIVLIACIIIGAIVIMLYKSVRRKRAEDEIKKKAIEDINSSVTLSVDDVIEEPEKPSSEDTSDYVEDASDLFDKTDKSEEKPSEEAPAESPTKEEADKKTDEATEKPAKPSEKTETATTEVEEKPLTDDKPSAPAEDKKPTATEKPVSPATAEEKNPTPSPAPAHTEDKKSETPAQKQTKAPSDKKPDPKKSRYTGKWIISEEDGRYTATLVASNGEVLLRSESYSALSGVKSGIDTINKNIQKNNFALSIDKNGKYFFKLYSSSTRLLCISEVYGTKALCESAMESVKRFSLTAVVVIEKKEE